MDEKELQRLYKAVSGQFDIGDYNTFKSKMGSASDRKKFYDAVGKNGFDLGDYGQYEKRLAGITPVQFINDSQRHQAIEKMDAIELDQYVNQKQEEIDKSKPKSLYSDPFAQNKAVFDQALFNQSREKKVYDFANKVVNGNVSPKDLGQAKYVAKVAPKVTKQLMQNLGVEVKDKIDDNHIDAFVNNAIQLGLDQQQKQYSGYGLSTVNKLANEGIDVAKLTDDKYSAQIQAQIDKDRADRLAQLETKYPQEQASPYFGFGYNGVQPTRRKDKEKYEAEVKNIDKFYQNKKDEIGISAAGAAYQKGITDPFELGMIRLKFTDPSTYGNRKNVSSSKMDGQIKGLGNEVVKMFGTKDDFVRAKDYDKQIQDEHPEDVQRDILTKLAAEKYKKDGSWLVNNPIISLKVGDELADNLSSEDKEAYEKYVRPELAKRNMEIPNNTGIVNNLFGGAATTVVNQVKAIGDWAGIRSKSDISQEILDEPYSQNLKAPQGRSKAQEAVDNTANFVGSVLPLIAEGGVGGRLLSGAGRSIGILSEVKSAASGIEGIANTATNIGIGVNQMKRIASMASFFSSMYDPALKQGMAEFNGNKGKATAYATGKSALNTLAFEMLPKAGKLLGKEAEQPIMKLINEAVENKLAPEAFSKKLADIIYTTGGEAVKEGLKFGGASALADLATNAIFNPQKFSTGQAWDEATQIIAHSFLDGALMGAWSGAVKSYKNYNIASNVLTKIGRDAEFTKNVKDLLNTEYMKGGLSEAEFNSKKELITALEEANKDLYQVEGIGVRMTDKEANKYTLARANEYLLKAKEEASTDPVIKSAYKEQVKQSEAVREQLLSGEAKVGEDGEIVNSKIEDNANEKGNIEQDNQPEYQNRDEVGQAAETSGSDSVEQSGKWEEVVDPALKDVESTAKALDDIDYVQEGIEDANIRGSVIDSLLKKATKDILDPTADKEWDKNHYQFNLQLLSSLIAEKKEYENIKKENINRDFTEMQGVPPKDENGNFIKNGKEYSNYIDRVVLTNLNKNIDNFKNYISEAYHKSKADGSNPELVKAVEDLLGGNEPPKPTESIEEVGQPEMTGITHAQTEKIRKEAGLPEYERNPEKVEDWIDEANKRLDQNPNEAAKVIRKMENNEELSPVEIKMMQRIVADLQAKVEQDPSDENLSNLKRVLEARDKANSLWGKQGRAIQGEVPVLSTLGDYMVAKMEANGVDKLTEEQKADVEQKYDALKKAKELQDEKLAQLETEYLKLKAEKELKKAASVRPKKNKTKEDFIEERKSYLEELKAAKEKHEQWLKNNNVQKMGVSGFTLTPEMVKPILKLAKSHVEETYQRAEEIAKKVYEDVKDVFEGITEKDILAVMAGQYNERKQTKGELLANWRDVQEEAKLIGKLEKILNGEVPTDPRKKVERNQAIKDLRDKIKSIKREQAEADKFYGEDFAEDAKKLLNIKKRNEIKQKQIQEKIKNKDYETEQRTTALDDPELKRKYPKLYQEVLDSIVAKEDAQHQLEIDMFNDEMARRSKTQKYFDTASDVLGTAKALVTTLDDSAVFMQSLVALPSHPKSAGYALVAHVQDAFSAKRFKRRLAELHNSKWWDLIQKSGLDITEPTSLKTEQKEETFDRNLLNKKIKIFGKEFSLGILTKPAERAFTSMGNSLRSDAFIRLASKYIEEGYTFEKDPKLFKDLANMLNTETGRGKLPEQLQRASKVLTAGIWSPRLMASRLNLLGFGDVVKAPFGGGYYTNLHPKIRKRAAADMAKFLAAGASVMALAAFAGGEVDGDPRSGTFGTVRFGNKTYNVWGGFTQYVRYIAQMLSGEQVKNGEVVDLKTGYAKDSYFGKTAKFVRSKMTPVFGAATDLFVLKEDFQGKPMTIGKAVETTTIPLAPKSMYQAMEKDGIVGLFNDGLPSFFGINVFDDRDFQEAMKLTGDEIEDILDKRNNKKKKTHEEKIEDKERRREREKQIKDYAEENGLEYKKR